MGKTTMPMWNKREYTVRKLLGYFQNQRGRGALWHEVYRVSDLLDTPFIPPLKLKKKDTPKTPHKRLTECTESLSFSGEGKITENEARTQHGRMEGETG